MPFDLSDYEYYLCSATLMCAMLGMGATLTVSDFRKVAQAPGAIAWILFLQLVISPCLALLLARLFAVPPGVAFGMIIVSALPGGLFSNVMAYMGGGNVALSVAATSVATVGCIVTTTMVLKIFGTAQLPPGFQMPIGGIFADIGVNMLLPLAIGLVVRRVAAEKAPHLCRFCARASLVLLAVYVVAFLASGRFSLAEYGLRTPLALLALGVIMVWLSYLVGRLARLSIDDTFTIAAEVLFRNAYLGVMLKASLFPANDPARSALGEGALFAVLLYGGISLGVAVAEVTAKRRGWGVYARRGDSAALEPEATPEQSKSA
ncbi:MAG: bile acid:sodium symporter [Pirellulaceae bacterium]|jgi:BASS family bile acid:Na+ symporter|nr:bile acid:sodium symporter [Pirellulaceae bacterium]MDP7019474.1 bile acid:sodium symporter [Pirellulaceae bacterium]